MMNMFRRQQQARTVRRPASSAQRPQPQLKSPREIQIMREAGRIVARVHAVLREAIRPGVSTWELDQLAAETMSKYNAASCFLGYRGFPAHICTSINEELVHGIPSKDRILKFSKQATSSASTSACATGASSATAHGPMPWARSAPRRRR